MRKVYDPDNGETARCPKVIGPGSFVASTALSRVGSVPPFFLQAGQSGVNAGTSTAAALG
jgi:hypothetical protein